MMKKYLLFLLICLAAVNFATAQKDTSSTPYEESTETEGEDDGPIEWLKGNMNDDKKFGVKLGTGLSTMLGGELNNPRPKFGLNGSLYYRHKYTPKAAVQAELAFSVNGSNFANNVGEYETIQAYYLGAPIMWVRSINEKNTSHIIVGLQYARLLNASLYVNPNLLPESQQPKLKKDDLMILAGTQFYAGFVGFQLVAKYGLVNINNGLISGLNPPLKNKDIHNFALEVNFLF